MIRLTSFFVLIFLFTACSSIKNMNTGCSNLNNDNYYIEKKISKNDISSISSAQISNLKRKLIAQISSSVSTKSVVFQGMNDGESFETFSMDASDVAYGYIDDPVISYCKKSSGWFVIMSINKVDFINKTSKRFEEELDIALKNVVYAIDRFDKSKQTLNNNEAKRFRLKSQQLQSMHSLVVNDNNFSSDEAKDLNNKLAAYISYTSEFIKLSYIFDDQMREINYKIESGNFKEAFADLNILLNVYTNQSSETVKINSEINKLKSKIKNEWEKQLNAFNENIRLSNILKAKSILENLYNLVILDGYSSKYQFLNNEFKVARKKFEKDRLLSASPKNQEFYFGINATTSYGNIISSDEALLLDPETTNFNFDKFLPSFKIGYRYYFNPKKRLGIFFQYKSNSNKFIELSSDADSDYEFPFNSNFNEAQVGFSAGAFDFSFGKILDKMDVNGNDVDFNTASVNLSIITTDGLPKGKRNYFNLYGGVNFISDMEDLSYTNLVIGLNYHLRFNRKLSKEDRKYLSTL